MQVLFKVIRQNSNQSPWIQTYTIDVNPSSTILDCLNRIKWEQDGSLAFRKNCRNTICGSCSMRINGRSALACKESVAQELNRQSVILEQRAEQTPNPGAARVTPQNGFQSVDFPEITIAPMGNMPVLKDLVVDMAKFWGNLQAVEPYISTAARTIPQREFLQTPAERAKLDQTGNCILCGACYSECNAVEVSSEFVGPHALAKAYRTVVDSRDDATESRLEKSNQGIAGVWGCTRCFNCNTVCPMEVAPLDQINRMKGEILDRQTETTSRSVRHRQVMIDLVKQGGWIDERRFGLRVVGNNFRDLRGVLSLIPLGLRMLQRGKFPKAFEPSPGTQEVRSLIESVQLLDASPSFMTETVSKPPSSLKAEPYAQLQPKFGWTPYAELTNGRFAMIGFVALLLQELLTHQDFFTWLGLR